MTTPTFIHHVLVDFENVPGIDLSGVAGKPVHVTLLIGKNQGKIDFALVEQIHRLAGQVDLVKLTSSGRNALDITLAYYLGRAIQRDPRAEFWIISKDKDFEPMLAHLQSKNIKAGRHDNFSTLPFFPKPKKLSPLKASSLTKSAPAVPGVEPEDRLEKFILRLKNNLAPRPKKKTSLLAQICTVFGGKLPETEQHVKLAALIQRGVIAIDAKNRISYPASVS